MRRGWWNSLNVRIYQIFCSEESLEESGFILSVSLLTAMQLGRSSSLEITCGTDCGQIRSTKPLLLGHSLKQIYKQIRCFQPEVHYGGKCGIEWKKSTILSSLPLVRCIKMLGPKTSIWDIFTRISPRSACVHFMFGNWILAFVDWVGVCVALSRNVRSNISHFLETLIKFAKRQERDCMIAAVARMTM